MVINCILTLLTCLLASFGTNLSLHYICTHYAYHFRRSSLINAVLKLHDATQWRSVAERVRLKLILTSQRFQKIIFTGNMLWRTIVMRVINYRPYEIFAISEPLERQLKYDATNLVGSILRRCKWCLTKHQWNTSVLITTPRKPLYYSKYN